jgi:hypothetical protein
MSGLNDVEELQDLLDSKVWSLIVGLVTEDIKPRRMSLLTSITLPEAKRIADVTRLATYKELFEALYKAAGRQLPIRFTSLFTGDV